MTKTSNEAALPRSAFRFDRSGQPNRRQGQIRQDNYAKILAAAETVFAERGFEGATTALIAKRSGIAKANVHYYFATKLQIYEAVICPLLDVWLNAFDYINSSDQPRDALTKYIRSKIEHSRTRPVASRVFANEIIRGAPILRPYLSKELRKWVRKKSKVLDQWAHSGKLRALENREHLFFVIWAATQTYADFGAQICYALGKKKLDDSDYEAGAKLITRLVLAGCGLDDSEPVSMSAPTEPKDFYQRKIVRANGRRTAVPQKSTSLGFRN